MAVREIVEHFADGPLPEQREIWTHTSVLCVECRHRWEAVRPLGTDFNSLECPRCGIFDSDLDDGGIVNVGRLHS